MNTQVLWRLDDAAGAGRDTLPPGFFQGASLHNLRQLVVMRNVAIVAQASTVLVVHQGLGIDLPLVAMGTTIAALALFNLATWRRVATQRPASDKEVGLQLLVDVAVLALLLGLSGGATNPFVGMFVLPLTITAACLGQAYTWLVALLTVAAYSVLVLVYRPMVMPGDEARHMQLLVSGMWVNYTITAAMIAHFVVRIATNLRQAQHTGALRRERELEREHLMRIGTLAAGAAHELAQPLSTMSLMLGEIEGRADDAQSVHKLARDLSRQLRNCQDTLNALLSYGSQTIDTGLETDPVDAFVQRCVAAFGSRRPDAVVQLTTRSPGAAPVVSHDMALQQALLNLLGNAADMSNEAIELRLQWDDQSVSIEIRDRGPGITAGVQERIGQLFFTTKPQGSGNGLGLCLAQVAVARLGGSLLLSNAQGGGAVARVMLPIAATKTPTG
jgi:two-component system, sensor histidine kinase RegB